MPLCKTVKGFAGRLYDGAKQVLNNTSRAVAGAARATVDFGRRAYAWIVGGATATGLAVSAHAQSTTSPVDTSALTTGLTTVTTIFNTVAGIVAAAVLFFVGVKVFKWIRK